MWKATFLAKTIYISYYLLVTIAIKMVTQEDLMPESLMMRWLTFSKRPSLLDDSYGRVILRIGLLLFAAMLFRLILVGTELSMAWALVALGFSLLVSLLLLILLDYLTSIYGTRRLLVFGAGMVVLAALVMILPML
jgi:hypothetical protein